MNKLITILVVTLIAVGASAIAESLPLKAQVSDSTRTKNMIVRTNPNSSKGDSKVQIKQITNGNKGSLPKDTATRRGHYMSSDTSIK